MLLNQFIFTFARLSIPEMIYHIVIGDSAAVPLKAALAAEPAMAGDVIIMKDILNVGPLLKEDRLHFSAMRSAFWQQVLSDSQVQTNDMERLLDLSLAMHKNAGDIVWLWMASLAADICAYYWVLPYLAKYQGRLYTINIAGLPFLDEAGKIFYPKSIGDISTKEIIKARKLARAVTPSEVEADTEEWQKLVKENMGIRIHEGGKRLVSKDESYYDALLANYCTRQYQKAARIASQALNKNGIPTGDLYLGWRLRQMAAAGVLLVKGEENKSLKDLEVKLPGGENDTAGTP